MPSLKLSIAPAIGAEFFIRLQLDSFNVALLYLNVLFCIKPLLLLIYIAPPTPAVLFVNVELIVVRFFPVQDNAPPFFEA